MLALGQTAIVPLLAMVAAIFGFGVASILFALFVKRPSDWWLLGSVLTILFGGAFLVGGLCLAWHYVAWWGRLLFPLPFASGVFSLIRWRRKRSHNVAA